MSKEGAFVRAAGPFFFSAAVILLGVRMLDKIFEAGSLCHASAWQDPALVIPLVLTAGCHLLTSVIAVAWSPRLKIPAAYLFLILPFLFYVILLVNALTLRIPPQAILVVLTGGGLFGALLPEGRRALARALVPRREKALALGLAVLLVGHAGLITLGQNFRPDRTPFSDEKSFWYVAAAEMEANGFYDAHTARYPGAGLHPFGIPFLSAYPALITGTHYPMIPFFMPLYIATALALFLAGRPVGEYKRQDWGLVFFVAAWFVAFNNRSWPGVLMYSAVYGESVSVMLVVALLGWMHTDDGQRTPAQWIAAAAAVGLLTVTKFPLILLSVAFVTVFLFRAWRNLRRPGVIWGMAAAYAFPALVLKIFMSVAGGHIGAQRPSLGLILQRLGHPNGDMLGRAVHNMWTDAENLCYFAVLAAVCSLLTVRHYRYGWPVLAWAGVLFVHYGYVYAYGADGVGDFASALRYMLPAMAGMLFLGSLGWSRLARWVEENTGGWIKPVCWAMMLGALLHRAF